MKTVVFFLLVIFSINGSATEIGSGHQGIARRRVMLARELVQPAMYTCLIQPSDCLISQAEADQLTKIYLAVAAPQSQNIIEFKSAAQNPGMFDVDSGSHRLAVTGGELTSPIYLNSDLIDPKGAALSLDALISIFVHEFGHHAGFHDSDEYLLDQLGNKVAYIFTQNVQLLRGSDSPSREVEVIVYNSISGPGKILDWKDRSLGTWPEIFATDGERIMSLGASYPLLLDCPYGSSVRHAWLSELHWKENGTVAAQNLHYCLMSSEKLPVRESFFMGLDFTLGPDGKLRMARPPAQQMIRIPLFELTSNISTTEMLGDGFPPVLLKVESVESSPSQLKNGGDWLIKAVVKGNVGDYLFCSLLVSSDELQLRYPSGQIQTVASQFGDCRMKAAGRGRIQIEATFRFSSSTVAHEYFLKAIHLVPRAFDKNPGVILPSVRQSVSAGQRSTPPSDIGAVKMTTKEGSAGAPTFGFVKYGLCQSMDFVFELPESSPLVQAHLQYTMFFRGGVLSPITLTERLNHGTWKGGTVVSVPTLGGGTRNTITISLFQEFMEPDQVERIEMRELTAMTADFAEHRLKFAPDQFGLTTYFGASCD